MDPVKSANLSLKSLISYIVSLDKCIHGLLCFLKYNFKGKLVRQKFNNGRQISN